MRAFYINENFNIVFPKREIYYSQPHEVWFKDEGIPTIGVIKGYFHDDHVSVFVNDFDIPPLHPAVIMDWFNTYKTLNYVELGANRIAGNYVPKLVMFRGGQLNLEETLSSAEEAKEEKSKSLVEEVDTVGAKEKIGF
jgi:hypothetical protein